VKRRIYRFLRRRGATPAEIADAEKGGYLALLVLDRSVLPGARRLTRRDVAQAAGVDVDFARQVWRALGFPDVDDDVQTFTDSDVRALRAFVERVRKPALRRSHDARSIQEARALSGALARIAEVEGDDLREELLLAREQGLTDEEIAERLLDFDFETVARLVDHAHRLQLRAVLWRKLGGGPPDAHQELAIGFVDLTGYTALTASLDDVQLAELLERFAALTHDLVVGHGGRIVKNIGDEVMYVADDVPSAAEIALNLVDATEADDTLPEVHVGLAFGPVLARDGDYFGPVVNFASRLTDVARPGTILVSAPFADALGGDPRFATQSMRARRLRDVGRVELLRLESRRV